MSKEDVDKYPSVTGHKHKLIPCQVNVDWVGGEKKDSFSHFEYKVEFDGAKDYYLAVRLPRLCLRELQICNNLLKIYVSGGGNPLYQCYIASPFKSMDI